MLAPLPVGQPNLLVQNPQGLTHVHPGTGAGQWIGVCALSLYSAMSLYNGPPRGGTRGGKDQFNWDNVKVS